MSTYPPTQEKQDGDVYRHASYQERMKPGAPSAAFYHEREDCRQHTQRKHEICGQRMGLKSVVKKLCSDGPRRGHLLCSLFPLIESYLGHHKFGPGHIIHQQILDKVVHSMIDELELCLGNALWQFSTPRSIPFQLSF